MSLGCSNDRSECALIAECRNAGGFVHVLLFRVMAATYRVRDETAPAIINAPIRIAILTGSFDAPTTSRYAIPHRTTIPEIQRMSIIAAELIAANISKVAFVARAVPRPAAANAFVHGVGKIGRAHV